MRRGPCRVHVQSFLDAYAFNLVDDPGAEHHHSVDAGYAINLTFYWPLCVALRPKIFPPLTSRQVFDPVCRRRPR